MVDGVTWRIGEIAGATNVTVRTLHYYEEIGLLAPTARSGAGHRLYGTEAVEQLYRITTLRQLGLRVDLAIAETEPFSATPGFPAHTGRFRYPLVVAHLKEGDQWIDADVDGPPLPPGRVSPELRGRTAIL